MNNFENQKDLEQETHLGLKGALTSFEGTALIPLIKSSLEAEGIKPYAYDLEESGHEEYSGFPATSVPNYSNREPNLSPIVVAIFEGLKEEKLILDKPENGSIRLKPWSMYPADGSNPWESNAHRTSKLDSASLLALKATESEEVLAYAVRLGSDGGRAGYAFISTNDVLESNPPQ